MRTDQTSTRRADFLVNGTQDSEEDLYCWTTIVKGPSQAAIACMNHQRRTDVVAVIVPRDNVTEGLHTGFDKLAVWGFRACMTMELQPPPAPLRGPAGELPLELHTHGIKC